MTCLAAFPHSDIVVFRSDSDERAWGHDEWAWSHLETEHALLGLVYRDEPAPKLTVAPPVRVPQGEADRFLDGVLDEYERTGEELWLAFGCDPHDGEVSLIVSPESYERVDDDIARIKAFFDEQFPVLARLCLPDTEACDDSDENEDDDEVAALRKLARLFDW